MSLCNNAIVFYHKNCMDGFGSAWAFHCCMEKNYNGNVQYIAAAYDDDFSYILDSESRDLNTDIYILDFSFKKEFIEKLCHRFNFIYLYDHHKTAIEELSNWKEQPKNSLLELDKNKSGAGICWEAFSEYKEEDGTLIAYIQDRDLWKFALPFSKEVTEYIKITPFTFSDYSNLSDKLKNNFDRVVEIGTYLRIQTEKIVNELAKLRSLNSYTHKLTGKNYVVSVVNAPGQFASDLGNHLCDTLPIDFAAIFYINEKGQYSYSLRSSSKTSNVDVSEIAKYFGGGGHRNAAGFVSDIQIWY